LKPGVGFVLQNPGPPFTVVWTGCIPTCPPPCLPKANCVLVGGNGINPTRWSDLSSCPPVCGTEVRIWTGSGFTTYTYGNSWMPGEPVLAAGQSAYVCLTNCPCPCPQGANAPVNDTPATAIALAAPATVSGCLQNANPTPLSVVGLFPPVLPAFSQQNAPDVWYSFNSSVNGVVTVDTCGATGCPTDTVLAVYQGSPEALLVNSTRIKGQRWFNDNMIPVCADNALASRVQFKGLACKTYYIRVSARTANVPPGSFVLNLTQQPEAPWNDACAHPQKVTANSSTRFNNGLATTDLTPSPSIFNDVWYRFTAPPLSVEATVEVCATFDCTFAVYTGSGCNNPPAVPLTLVAANCPPGSIGRKVLFPVMPGQQYRIRVGGVTAADVGCGFLRVSSGLPPANTLPVGSPTVGKAYRILGLPSGQPWSWSLTSPRNCGFNIEGTVSGVLATGTAYDVAAAFAASINMVAGPGIQATASNVSPPRPETSQLKIFTPCDRAGVVLKVGTAGGSPDCWVANQALLGAISPCVFNPGIYEIADPEADPDIPEPDCNGNGMADYVDIVTGTSLDLDDNGVPDECPVRLYISYEPVNNGIVISWPATDAVLEQSTNIAGPWTAVPDATSPHAVSQTPGQKFYRLRVP